jgi:hypothetical protein
MALGPPDSASNVRPAKVCADSERGTDMQAMGEPDQLDAQAAARRARDEMHSVTESLRALLEDLRHEDAGPDDQPRVVRSPGIAPSP